jgi:hypothetical protein
MTAGADPANPPFLKVGKTATGKMGTCDRQARRILLINIAALAPRCESAIGWEPPNLLITLGVTAMKTWFEVDVHYSLEGSARKRVRELLKENGLLNKRFRTWDESADAQADFMSRTGVQLKALDILECCHLF